MRKSLSALGAVAILFFPGFSAHADTGPAADIVAIRKLATISNGRCPQRVSHVSVSGSYGLATVEQHGACDAATVWVFARKGGAWRSTGGIGGVPDACTIHSKGVPLAIAPGLIRAFTGSSNASLTSTKSCGG
jgi:hypothetical protein